MQEIQLNNHNFSVYHAEFPVIAADLDWNTSALQNGLRMGQSEEMKVFFTHSHMSEGRPTFVTGCPTWDNQIRPQCAEMASQNKGKVIGFTYPRPPAPPKAPKMAPTGTVA
jgi:hypothetical protein